MSITLVGGMFGDFIRRNPDPTLHRLRASVLSWERIQLSLYFFNVVTIFARDKLASIEDILKRSYACAMK
jgi:hypothetical protein